MANEFINELKDLFKAKIRHIAITTAEENRCLTDILAAIKMTYSRNLNDIKIDIYSSQTGVREYNIIEDMYLVEEDTRTKPNQRLLEAYKVSKKRCEKDTEYDNNVFKVHVYICKDFLSLGQEDMDLIIRRLDEIGQNKKMYFPIIIIGQSLNMSLQIQKLFHVLKFDTMKENEIQAFLSKIAESHKLDLSEEKKAEIAKAAVGLTLDEIANSLRLSLVKTGELNAEELLKEKMQIIQKSGILSYKYPKLSLNDVGGHKILKTWIEKVKLCMNEDALNFGIDPTRGFIAAGLPGSGKTAIAEAIAKYFNMPLVIFDLSKIMGGIVGESERQASLAFNVIDSLNGCVILVDECEKTLGGVKSSNNSDGGTMARVFSIFLNRMNENNKDFYIFTSNDMSALPPELTRSGRLDTKWFFNYPSFEERKEIFNIHFKKRKHEEITDKQLNLCANLTDHYTGAEIEQSVKNILKNAYIRLLNSDMDNKSIIDIDITSGIKEVSTIYDLNPSSVISSIQKSTQNGLKPTSISSNVGNSFKNNLIISKDTGSNIYKNFLANI